MAQRGGALLRGGHGMSRATFLELFLDLAFVFAFTRVSVRFIDEVEHGLTVLGFLETLILFLALWHVWTLINWVTSRYEPDALTIQLVVVGTMFGSLVMAVTVPRGFEERALPFVVAYLVTVIARPLIIAAVLGRHPRRTVPWRLAAWAALSGAFWLAGALGHADLRFGLWALAITIDLTGYLLGWPVPGLGRAPVSAWRIAGEHIAERYQQIFLIALGETILVIGITYSGEGFGQLAAAAFTVAFLTTALLWRIYFHRAGHLLVEALRLARSPGRLGASASTTHLVMVLGVLLTGVGYELVIVKPFDRVEPAWLIFIVGGPVLFLLGRTRFEYEIFARVSRRRVLMTLVLVGSAPLLLLGTPMLALSVVAGGLAVVAVVDGLRARDQPMESSASPLDRPDPGDANFPT
ncbi:low temperature requirement protein A [Verrucosispora sioxanthis]|uniref:Low temperature requirement protein A n=1 Tax=Verrucosispora sioxanthis TaxID=2499994 RepID=A0A6M1KUJ9_9ACTN|nr:low temperature requirement protein A [Verrucosispora sioxanthis]NEE62609.1 low temperature requirement protein A [Verrucosispora sioxanthis]NGM11719.1 low temperature requirement protein A [Verrucosispora sioxanthis]